MNDVLQTALIVLSLLLVVAAVVYVALDRPTGRLLLGGLALLELGLLVQAVVGIVQLARDESPGVNGPVFVGYLLGTLLFVPAAAWWALGERSRAGTAALIVVGLVVPVMILRLQQIWTAPSV
jgi:hypothetical protein